LSKGSIRSPNSQTHQDREVGEEEKIERSPESPHHPKPSVGVSTLHYVGSYETTPNNLYRKPKLVDIQVKRQNDCSTDLIQMPTEGSIDTNGSDECDTKTILTSKHARTPAEF
jgi:hypothetical protein